MRVATLGDVETFERRKVDRADRERTKEGWRAVARYVDIESGVGRDKKEILVDAGYLKADDGSKENHGGVRRAPLPGERAGVTVRKRPLVHLSLSPDAIARLAEIATRCGETRSGVVEKLIREAEMPRPRTAGATRT